MSFFLPWVAEHRTPQVNPSTPRAKGWDLLRVDPEPRPFTPSLKTGLGAAERVKKLA